MGSSLVLLITLVGLSALDHFESFRHGFLWYFLLLPFAILICLRMSIPLFTWRGRRLVQARWRRWRRWEYWPAWIVYLPIVWRALGHARRYGGFTVPTAVNPLMPAGGIVGESKSAILAAFGPDHPHIARFALLKAHFDTPTRARLVDEFLERHDLDLPVVLKPDAGQRGEGVAIVRDRHDLDRLIERQSIDLLVQEYVGGEEFGIFYVREHEERPGRIFSLTEKRPLVIEGDGVGTLERMILRDSRALALAPRHLRRHVDQLDRVLGPGERFVVTELGTHALGSIFLDASGINSPELEASIERLSRDVEGFRFGRYDVRVRSREALQRGEGYKVIELNGLTSEATHVYDSRFGFSEALGTLQAQWELAYRIGADQVARGHRVSSLREILQAWRRQRRHRRFHAEDRVRTVNARAFR